MRLHLAVVLCACLARLANAQSTEHTNVLLLVADDLGVDKLSCYAAGTTPPPPTTPVLDALAANGVRFTCAYSNPLCSPTRAAIQTGRHGFRTGVGTNAGTRTGLSPSEITLAEMLDLEQTGYAHAAIGKWHLGYHQFLGVPGNPFDQGYGYFAGTQGNFSPRTIPPEHYEWWPKTTNGQLVQSTTYATVDNVDEALSFIASQGSSPWFCYVAFNAPHTPLRRPPGSSLPNATPAAGEAWWPYHHAMVEHMDAEIGRLLDGIVAFDPKVREATLVLFTSDNGTASAASGPMQVVFPPFDPTRAKGTVFEGGVHVPLIANGREVETPGRVSDAFVHAVDLFRTIAEVAGADLGQPGGFPTDRTLDSISFLPVLRNQSQHGGRSQVFCELFKPNLPQPGMPFERKCSLRDARYKLIALDHVLPEFALQFYDLSLDPSESNNLLLQPGGLSAAQREAYQDLAASLQALLSSS